MADAYGAGILLGEVLTAQHERAESALKGAEARFREMLARRRRADAEAAGAVFAPRLAPGRRTA